MGWCSGTEIFDTACTVLLSEEELDKKRIIEKLIDALESMDWDCQSDSEYFDHPLVNEIFKELHPDWFEE